MPRKKAETAANFRPHLGLSLSELTAHSADTEAGSDSCRVLRPRHSSAIPAAEEVLATLATPTTATAPTAAPLTAGIVIPDSPAALSQSNGDHS